MSDFNIHTLGCGSAKPSLRHHPSSTVIDYRGNLFMVDCGEGAQLSLQKQHLKFSRLSHVFLTHLHGDHVFGLPGLVGTLGLSQIGGSLTIHTFAEGKKILTDIFGYFCRELPYEIQFNVIEPKDAVIFETSSLRIRTVALRHRVPDVGFIFEEKTGSRHLNREMADFHGVPRYMFGKIKEGEDFIRPDGTVIPNSVLTTSPTPPRSYAHISDTSYMPKLAEKIGPVDLLMHETTYLQDHAADAKARGHSTAAEAATVARDAGVGTLLTGHYSSRYHDETLFLKEAQEIFPNVILNREGLITPIEPKVQR